MITPNKSESLYDIMVRKKINPLKRLKMSMSLIDFGAI